MFPRRSACRATVPTRARPQHVGSVVRLARLLPARLLDLPQELDVRLATCSAGRAAARARPRARGPRAPAELPDDLELLVAHQHLLAAGAALDRVDGREEPLVRELSAQSDHQGAAMARARSALILLVATVFSTGCFNSTTLIKVKPDGSGTVEQTLTMNTEMLKQLAGMMGAMASGSGGDGKVTTKGPTSPDDSLTEEEARKMAERMGPGGALRFPDANEGRDRRRRQGDSFVRGHQQGRGAGSDLSVRDLREGQGRTGPVQDGARRRHVDADRHVPRQAG